MIFDGNTSSASVKAEIEGRLLAYVGRPLGVTLRTASEMRAVLEANPFPQAAPNHTVAIFLDEPPPPDALDHAVGITDEEMRLGTREIFVHYRSGRDNPS